MVASDWQCKIPQEVTCIAKAVQKFIPHLSIELVVSDSLPFVVGVCICTNIIPVNLSKDLKAKRVLCLYQGPHSPRVRWSRHS